MDEGLKGKKVLIMSGSTAAREIVYEAHKMGVLVYATDYYKTSPVKEIADKSFMVSTADVDAIVRLYQEERLDGIFSGYTDSVLPYMQRVASILKVPFWGTEKSISMSINKELFKEACEKSGIPVVPWIRITPSNYREELSRIQLPVVIKPVDNSGSRGVFKCLNKSDLFPSCEKAFAYSTTKCLLVEQQMNANNEFSVYYIMNHGNIFLTGMGDRYVYEINPKTAPVGQGMKFPSIRLNQWIEEMDPIMKKFFRDNNMNDGFVFVQGFHERGKFFIHEIGYRLNGGFSYKLVEFFSGYNQIQQLIRYALTGNMEMSELKKSDPYFNGGIGMILTASLRKGTVSRIEGVENVLQLPHVIKFYKLKDVGTVISSEGTTAEVFAYIMIAVSTKEELSNTILQIGKELKVFDENDRYMLNPILDPDRLIYC